MKKIVAAILIIFSFSDSFAQQYYNFEGSFLEFGVGAKYSKLYDASITDIHYQGAIGGVNIKYHNIRADRFWWVEIAADGGFYNRDNFPSYSIREANHYSGFYNLGYLNVFKKFSNESYLYGGATLRGRGVYNQMLRSGNNTDNYVILNNFGPTFMYHHTFYLFKNWWYFEWQLSLPIVTYYIRPGYAVSSPNESFGSSDITFIPNFYEIDSELRLVFPMGNKNKIAIEYTWDFYSLDRLNKVQAGAHGLFVNFIFNLNFKQPWGVR